MSLPERSFMNGSTPTVVLLHGAFADASSWAGVIAALQLAGIGVVAPAVPLRGLSADADYIASVAAQFDGPVLLVGHSYGGAVATVAAARAGNVVGLVYVTAFALDEGESSSETAAGFPRTGFAAALRPATFRTPGGRTAVELSVRADAFPGVLAADLPPATAAVLAAGQRPIAAAALDEKADAAGWRTLPSWYLVAAADRAIHPDAQRHMAQRAGADVVEVDASHLVALSQPAAVADLIRTAALTVRAARVA
jgi:pimeloyl-ACP methyl ester carboxylesterase